MVLFFTTKFHYNVYITDLFLSLVHIIIFFSLDFENWMGIVNHFISCVNDFLVCFFLLFLDAIYFQTVGMQLV